MDGRQTIEAHKFFNMPNSLRIVPSRLVHATENISTDEMFSQGKWDTTSEFILLKMKENKLNQIANLQRNDSGKEIMLELELAYLTILEFPLLE